MDYKSMQKITTISVKHGGYYLFVGTEGGQSIVQAHLSKDKGPGLLHVDFTQYDAFPAEVKFTPLSEVSGSLHPLSIFKTRKAQPFKVLVEKSTKIPVASNRLSEGLFHQGIPYLRRDSETIDRMEYEIGRHTGHTLGDKSRQRVEDNFDLCELEPVLLVSSEDMVSPKGGRDE